jgi:hypothetical protein
MGLFESVSRPETDPDDRDLALSLAPPPPRKKSTTHPKMSPHQIFQAKWHVRVSKQSCKQANHLILWGVGAPKKKNLDFF